MNPLTHLDDQGQARMVDVSAKNVTLRRAIAMAEISMELSTLDAIQSGNAPKGDVLAVARLAGIMAAKQTAQLIPLCHPLPLLGIDVRILLDENIPGYRIESEIRTKAETGVEMEALTAVTIAALTLYDMAKALDPKMVISEVKLLHKSKTEI